MIRMVRVTRPGTSMLACKPFNMQFALSLCVLLVLCACGREYPNWVIVIENIDNHEIWVDTSMIQIEEFEKYVEAQTNDGNTRSHLITLFASKFPAANQIKPIQLSNFLSQRTTILL